MKEALLIQLSIWRSGIWALQPKQLQVHSTDHVTQFSQAKADHTVLSSRKSCFHSNKCNIKTLCTKMHYECCTVWAESWMHYEMMDLNIWQKRWGWTFFLKVPWWLVSCYNLKLFFYPRQHSYMACITGRSFRQSRKPGGATSCTWAKAPITRKYHKANFSKKPIVLWWWRSSTLQLVCWFHSCSHSECKGQMLQVCPLGGFWFLSASVTFMDSAAEIKFSTKFTRSQGPTLSTICWTGQCHYHALILLCIH